MMHPQLLNDLATARRVDFGREVAQPTRAHVEVTHRGPRVRSRVVAGFLVRVATRIDPSIAPATRKAHAPAFNA